MFCRALYIILLPAIALLTAPSVEAAFTVKQSVDRVELRAQEQLTLWVESTGDTLPRGDPDTQLLTKNFKILSKNVSTRRSIRNGTQSAQRTWRFVLQPKRSGKLQIPALRVDNQRGAPLQLTVRSAASAPARQSSQQGKKQNLPEVFMEGSVDRTSIPVQSQLLHTLQVFTAINISGKVSEPSFDKSIPVHKISERNYPLTRQGRRYTVYEWKYAIFPQKSGTLTIPPATLNARRGGQSRTFKVSSERIRIEVQPIPAGLPGGIWLPAEKVVLREEWSQSPDQELEIGKPITRKIQLQAEYLLGVQLPMANSESVDGLKIYPEKPRFESKKTNQGVVGIRRDTQVLIPTRPGTLRIPEIRIPWWDMKNNQLKDAVLPERTLRIRPAAAAAALLQNDNTSDLSIITAAGEYEQAASDLGSPSSQPTFSLPTLPWLLTILLLSCGCGFFALLWYREYRANRQVLQRRKAATQKKWLFEENALTRAEEACKSRNIQQLRSALLAWAQSHWPGNTPHSLRALCTKLQDPELEQALQEIDQNLYSDESDSWESAKILTALRKLRRQRPLSRRQRWFARRREDALPPLYGAAKVSLQNSTS